MLELLVHLVVEVVFKFFHLFSKQIKLLVCFFFREILPLRHFSKSVVSCFFVEFKSFLCLSCEFVYFLVDLPSLSLCLVKAVLVLLQSLVDLHDGLVDPHHLRDSVLLISLNSLVGEFEFLSELVVVILESLFKFVPPRLHRFHPSLEVENINFGRVDPFPKETFVECEVVEIVQLLK